MEISSGNLFILTWPLLLSFYDSILVLTQPISMTIESSTPELPPLLFPEDNKIYRIVPPNETALKILQKNSKVPSSSLFPRERLFLDDPRREIFKVNNNMHADDIPEVFPSEYAASLKSEVEEIQPDNKIKSKVELEEQFRSVSGNLNSQINQIYPEDIEMHNTSPPKLHHIHITAILIAGVCIIGFVIYAGLLSYKLYLEKRYGMRERLVTHDDYCNSEGRFDI